MLSGLTGDIAIPKAVGGATTAWLDEASTVSTSDQAFAQLGMTPKRLAASTAYTKQLVAQSSIDMEGFVRNDLMSVIALAIDLAALEGTGAAGQPLGILNTDGINTVTFGASPTWAKVVEFETNIATDNADVNSMNYLTTPAVRGALKTTERASGTASFIWENNTSPVNGYGANVTNQISDNKVFFGDFSQLLVGMWDGLDVTVDPFTLAANGQIRIVMQNLVDIAIRHAESFCVSTDAGNQ
jgi:HK97 family phage major capsid protein